MTSIWPRLWTLLWPTYHVAAQISAHLPSLSAFLQAVVRAEQHDERDVAMRQAR